MWILKQKPKAKSYGTINQKVNAKTGLCTLLHVACGTTGFLLFVTILSGIVLSSTTIHAANPAQSNVTVNVNTACTASGGGTYSAKAVPGNTVTIAGSTFSTVCNDSEGYSIYAIGYGDESYDTPTNTQMIGEGGIGNIVTGTAKSGNTSNWAMQVTPTSGSAPTITNGFDSADFHVVPETYTQVAKYTSTTASPTATGARIDAKYQAYVISTQAIGTYTGKVKYTMVHPNTAPTPHTTPYLQDATLADCGKTMYDKRDEKDYTTALINGRCWMTQNLRYLGDTGSAANTMTIGNNNSNVSNKDITLYSLDSSNAGNFNPYSYRCYSTDGYNNACVYDSGSETTGVWYNYYAASGGTIRGSDNPIDATNDICPSGWHLPSGPNTTSGTDFNKLVGNTTSGMQDPTAGFTAFGAVAGGIYYNGSLVGTATGRWWSTTAYQPYGLAERTDRYDLFYRSSDGKFLGDGYASRTNGRGFFVRCVMRAPTMQSTTTSELASMMPNDGDSTILSDARDGNEYQITKINGEYWMTQNLRFTGTELTTDTSNVSTDKTLSYGKLTSGDSYTEPRISNYHDTTRGVWYNFCAAGANESNACNDSGTYSSSYDICPKNWHLPTSSQFSGITSYKDAFSPVTGGTYSNGSLIATGSGRWWSAKSNGPYYQYYLYYDGSSLGVSDEQKFYGQYVRCVRSS